jgi:hypothetical protein
VKTLILAIAMTAAVVGSPAFADAKDAKIPATFIGEWCAGFYDSELKEYRFSLPSWYDGNCQQSQMISVDEDGC